MPKKPMSPAINGRGLKQMSTMRNVLRGPKRETVVREFRQQDRTGRTHCWIITVSGDTVSLTDGLLDGKLKEPTTHIETGVNVGRANETSADEQAQRWADRQIDLKRRKGYREVDGSGKYIEEEVRTTLDFRDLPENFRVYKPLNSANAYMQKMMDDSTAWWVRKRNGCMALIVNDDDSIFTVYSSTLQKSHKDETICWAVRYPHIMEDIKRLNLPPRTILLGELCCLKSQGFEAHEYDRDDLDYINGVRGSLTDVALQTQGEHGFLGYCIWDILFWNGECLAQSIKYSDRIEHVIGLVREYPVPNLTFPEICTVSDSKGFLTAEITSLHRDSATVYGVPKEASLEKFMLQMAKDLGWEGWVVVDPNSTYGDRAYNFRGKAERPKECVKSKPKCEADFIVRWDPDNGIGERGKGRKKHGVGSVFCYLWDPDKGEEVYIGKCGGGFTDADITNLAHPGKYPMVFQVEFSSWTAKGSFQFPEKRRIRDDKALEECTLDQRPPVGQGDSDG